MGKRFVRTPEYCEKQRRAALVREAKIRAARQIKLALAPSSQVPLVSPVYNDPFGDSFLTPATTLQQPPVATTKLSTPMPVADIPLLLSQLASVEKVTLETVAAKLETTAADIELYLRDTLKTSWQPYHDSQVRQAWLTIRSQLLKQAQSGDIRSIIQLVEELADREDQPNCPTKGSCPNCPRCNHLAQLSTAEVLAMAKLVSGPRTIEDRLKIQPGQPGGYASHSHLKLVITPADSDLTPKPAGVSSSISQPTTHVKTEPVTAGLFATDNLLPKGDHA